MLKLVGSSAENGYYSISIYVTALQPWENFNTFKKKKKDVQVRLPAPLFS